MSRSVLLGSLPSFIHVTAFGLLTCALTRPNVSTALIGGVIWAFIDILWELSCANHQAWLRFVYRLLGIDSVPTCTYDRWDILASIIGAVMTTCIVWLTLKIHSFYSSRAQEQQQ